MSDARIRNFTSFVRGVGASFDESAVRFSSSPLHGFGVFARSPINRGTVLATVPKAAILSVENASLWQHLNKQHAATADDANEHPRDSVCDPLFQLPAALLFEALFGDRSPWRFYIDVLPSTLAEIGVPLAEDPARVAKVCQGTGIDVLTRTICVKLREVFDQIIKPLLVRRGAELDLEKSVVENVTFDQFLLAFAWATSRAFAVDAFHGNSMVPIADMFNHCTDGEHVHIEGAGDDGDGSDGSLSDEDEGTDSSPSRPSRPSVNGVANDKHTAHNNGDPEVLKIVCVKDIAPGNEIFNTFGQKPNTLLYLNYGFTEEHNAYDTALVHRLDIEHVLQRFSEQAHSADRSMTPSRKACVQAAASVVFDEAVDDYFQITTDGSFCHGILLLVYLHVAPWADLQPFCEDELELIEHLMQLSVLDILNAGGAPVRQIVSDIVERQLAKYPAGTSLASDEAALAAATEHTTPLERHALRLRIGQRKALKTAFRQLVGVEEENRKAEKRGSECKVQAARVSRVRKRLKTGLLG
ncbi:N-lysine methyltransferase setd6 [Gracilariopsis chorda]|uniref:N-lysine methyltransferase setd6 n=1 Tax=Gracilariopsis chorda TaxID=448386 RepID=A0A2V3IDG8_9FLOR|nr:N-lysine methyltransferase setd6 [Gracilariopsis chorda]|eukprot:PXF40107.1 N-lysine methyltransferase setd6 [Gracilariopsis chorda]